MASAAAPWHPHFYYSPLLLLFFLYASASVPSDSDILLRFKASLSPSVKGLDTALHNWVPGSEPCRYNRTFWTGVLCNGDGTVRGVQLENMNLAGELNTDALAVLPMLRTMSFMNNSFRGPIPDLTKIPALRSLFLSSNHFSGEVPDGIFDGMQALKKVHLARNDFSGRIPTSLLKRPRLLELRLDDNNFEGTIPDFRQLGLHLFNVSYNNLRGPIPTRLRKMHVDMFAGNDDLCGAPLGNSCNIAPHPEKYPAVFVIGIILIIIGVILILIALLLIFCRRRRARHDGAEPEKMALYPAAAGASKKKSGKLIFLREAAVKFDLLDLLGASAEILGSASFGSTYKAILPLGPAVVVKRFKEMNGMGKENFHEHMARIGRLSHRNLLPLVAYCYRKEEKLFVTDFISNGSLALLLHGSHGSKASPLDWPTRLKIVKGIARGLSYLADELPVLPAPHGHLKSSNVLLNYTFDAILSDYALIPLVNRARATQLMVAFKSPECAGAAPEDAGAAPSKKSDVWSLGILILEILTGKFPESFLRTGNGGGGSADDLAGWVASMVAENRAREVFDDSMNGTQGAEPEMIRLLRIGLDCSEAAVEKRCELEEAVARIEALSESDDCRSLSELSL